MTSKKLWCFHEIIQYHILTIMAATWVSVLLNLSAIVALTIAVILNIIALSSPDWVAGYVVLDNDNVTGITTEDPQIFPIHFGLFTSCIAYECVPSPISEQSGWFQATTGLYLTGAIITYILLPFVILLLCCKSCRESYTKVQIEIALLGTAFILLLLALVILGLKAATTYIYPSPIEELRVSSTFYVAIAATSFTLVSCLLYYTLGVYMSVQKAPYYDIEEQDDVFVD